MIARISKLWLEMKFTISDTFSVGKLRWLRSPFLQFQCPTTIAVLGDLFPFIVCIYLLCFLREKCGPSFFFVIFNCFVIFLLLFLFCLAQMRLAVECNQCELFFYIFVILFLFFGFCLYISFYVAFVILSGTDETG